MAERSSGQMPPPIAPGPWPFAQVIERDDGSATVYDWTGRPFAHWGGRNETSNQDMAFRLDATRMLLPDAGTAGNQREQEESENPQIEANGALERNTREQE